MSSSAQTGNTRLLRVLWKAAGFILAATVGLPILILLLKWGTLGFGEQEIWQHLLDTKLERLVGNTVILILGVGSAVCLLGISLAWLVSMCEFPGRRIFDWALMLPLAIPGYVMAFVFLGLFNYAGPVQTLWRQWFSRDAWFPDIQGAGGIILVLSLVLYPYVYMLARAAFLAQGRTMMDSARILGHKPLAAFFKIALPVARPAIAGGVALALMETLADFGAVSVFNFDTFTTAIYTAWYGLFNLAVAAQLASMLLLFVGVTLALEHYSRRQARYNPQNSLASIRPYPLTGAVRWLAAIFCSSVLLFAFGIPVTQLVLWAIEAGAAELDSRYLDLVHTLLLAATAGCLTVFTAVLLALLKKQSVGRWSAGSMSVRIATLGYALPGSVLAVGIMLMFTWLGQGLSLLFKVQIVLTGGLVALLLAYLTRFMAVGFTPVDAALGYIRPTITEAARSLGASPLRVFWRVYLPMLRPGLFTALIIVFVDVMKEMPATLMMRPFGWDTLAVTVYGMTAEGQWERAALPALTLLLAGLIPVVLLVRSSAGKRRVA